MTSLPKCTAHTNENGWPLIKFGTFWWSWKWINQSYLFLVLSSSLQETRAAEHFQRPSGRMSPLTTPHCTAQHEGRTHTHECACAHICLDIQHMCTHTHFNIDSDFVIFFICIFWPFCLSAYERIHWFWLSEISLVSKADQRQWHISVSQQLKFGSLTHTQWGFNSLWGYLLYVVVYSGIF